MRTTLLAKAKKLNLSPEDVWNLEDRCATHDCNYRGVFDKRIYRTVFCFVKRQEEWCWVGVCEDCADAPTWSFESCFMKG